MEKKEYSMPQITLLGEGTEIINGYTGVQDEYYMLGYYKPCAGTWAS